MSRVFGGLAAIGMTMLLVACASGPTSESPSVVAKHPLHIGVYYSAQFTEAKYGASVEAAGGPRGYSVGAASVVMFDEGLSQVFEKVTRLQSMSREELSDKKIDLLVVPTIEHLSLPFGFTSHNPREHAIAYRTTLRTTAGVPLASWLLYGTASHWTTLTTPLGLIDAYIKDAQVNFVGVFQREATATLAVIAARREFPDPPADLATVAITASLKELPSVAPAVAARLQQLGVVTVRINAKSLLERPLELRASDMRLRLKDGRSLDPEAVSEIALLYVVGWSGGRFYGVNPATQAVGGVIVGTLSQGNRYEEFLRGPRPQVLGNRMLVKNKDESGIVLFRLKDPALASDAVLTVWVLDTVTGNGARREMPLR